MSVSLGLQFVHAPTSSATETKVSEKKLERLNRKKFKWYQKNTENSSDVLLLDNYEQVQQNFYGALDHLEQVLDKFDTQMFDFEDMLKTFPRNSPIHQINKKAYKIKQPDVVFVGLLEIIRDLNQKKKEELPSGQHIQVSLNDDEIRFIQQQDHLLSHKRHIDLHKPMCINVAISLFGEMRRRVFEILERQALENQKDRLSNELITAYKMYKRAYKLKKLAEYKHWLRTPHSPADQAAQPRRRPRADHHGGMDTVDSRLY